MVISEELKDYISGADLWLQMFDTVRLIEAGGSHRVCTAGSGTWIPTEEMCYRFWNREEKCANCVSRQACRNGRQMVKIEYKDDSYYFVIARPVTIEGREYILEAITNITDQLATGCEDSAESNFVMDIIHQLDAVSTRDSMTGLYNKAYLQKSVEAALAEAGEGRVHVYMAMIDIDHFKQVNDRYGHACGDIAIRELASLLQGYVTPSIGESARYGGDEFAVLFHAEDKQQCIQVMERIRREMGEIPFRSEGTEYHVTISYGIDDIAGARDYREAVEWADSRLYIYKRRGRRLQNLHQGTDHD